jgi:flagellar export protein FliJ
MKKFSFPLESARRLRQQQQELEEAKLGEIAARLHEWKRRIASLDAERDQAEGALRGRKTFEGAELSALENYRSEAARRRRNLEADLGQERQRLGAQRQVLVEAKRRVELLERLKEKALADWRREWDKEQEQAATEVHLANRARR